jgi:hypothetical protein
MRFNLKALITFTSIVITLGACQYELSGEFNQEIAKPPAGHIGSITLSQDMDSIIIYEPTEIKYAVNTFGLQCNGIQLEYLKTKITNQYSSTGVFTITPDFTVSGWFDLKADFYLGTGSGSIADKFKAENYVGTKTWKVRFVDLTKINFQYQQHINKDGLVELYWIKPSYLPYISSELTTFYTTNYQLSKVVRDTTFFVDSTYYVGDSKSYNLRLSLNNKQIASSTLYVNYPLPDISIKSIGLDSTLISWTKSPVKQYYKIYPANAGQQYIFTGYGNSYKIKSFLGIEQALYLEVYPFKYKKNSSGYKTISTRFTPGEPANYKFHYSYVKDQFYIPGSISTSLLEKVDVTTASGNAYASNGLNKFELWGNHQGTRFVEFYYGDIHIFDETLNEIKKINVCGQYENNYGGQMTDDNCFGYYNHNENLYNMINVGDNPSWQKFSFTPSAPDETIWGKVMLTLDGKYAFWLGSKYFTVFDVSNHTTARMIYQYPRSFANDVVGNPLNYNEVVIGKANKIEIRSLPDFRLIKQFDMPDEGNVSLLTVDTYSNSVLAISQNFFHVIQLSDMSEKVKFPGMANSYARLHRNNFFINGTKTDLTPYFKKP